MKIFAVILSIFGLTILGYMILQCGPTDTTRSGIFMHPSNFDKAPIEQAQQLEDDTSTDIPTLDELQKELKNEG